MPKKTDLFLTAAGAGAAIAAYTLMRGRDYDFRGKTVLLTGGSRGLGLVMARQLAKDGARLAICARDEHDLQQAEQQLRSFGGEVLSVPCNVADFGQVRELVRRTVRHFRSLDVLINNAGIISVGPLETMTLADYHEAMDINFWGPLHTILAAVPEMKKQRSGRIVNIASIGGKISVPHLVPYSASKFALIGLSRGLRAELKKDGIVVTTICPGLMRTGSPRNATFKGQHRAEYAWFSISDSLPLTSMNAERAARQILAACRRGDAEVILTTQAKLAVKLDALFPEFSSSMLALANRLMPEAGGIGASGLPGSESESAASPSVLTALGDAAARRNNEL
jgi:NAD(P)-dependent dehydrogenase (short-subunit alcohol dehydrogenase family)